MEIHCNQKGFHWTYSEKRIFEESASPFQWDSRWCGRKILEVNCLAKKGGEWQLILSQEESQQQETRGQDCWVSGSACEGPEVAALSCNQAKGWTGGQWTTHVEHKREAKTWANHCSECSERQTGTFRGRWTPGRRPPGWPFPGHQLWWDNQKWQIAGGSVWTTLSWKLWGHLEPGSHITVRFISKSDAMLPWEPPEKAQGPTCWGLSEPHWPGARDMPDPNWEPFAKCPPVQRHLLSEDWGPSLDWTPTRTPASRPLVWGLLTEHPLPGLSQVATQTMHPGTPERHRAHLEETKQVSPLDVAEVLELWDREFKTTD